MRELKRISGTLEKARSDLKRFPSIDLLQDYDDLYAKHVSAITQQKINQDRIKDLRYKLDHHVYDAELKRVEERLRNLH